VTDPRPIDPGRVARGRIRPPGSKSVANRLLPLAAAAATPSVIAGLPDGDDVRVMVEALRAAGTEVLEAEHWTTVVPRPRRPARIDVRASGTTMRFLTAWAATQSVETTLDGTARMRERPLGPLCDALATLGVEVRCAGGYPPVTVRGPLQGGEVTVDASTSSQFASALLLAAPGAASDLTVRVADPVSVPYLAATVEALGSFGIPVDEEPDGWTVGAGPYPGADLAVPPDASGAVYAWGAAAVTGGDVLVEGLDSRDGSQADLRVLDALEAMGCSVTDDVDGIRLRGPSTLVGIDSDLSDCPDGAMAVAVICLFADGPSRLRGLSTLAVKETDRLVALATELRKLGAEVAADDDSLQITPGAPRGAVVETYDDHRMAMAFTLAGLRVPGVSIADPGCVSKTWPSYFEDMDRILHPVVDVIAIDGPAGTGKTTVSRRVAERLGRVRLDTGAFYRTATLLAHRLGVGPEALAGHLGGHRFTYDDGVMRLDGEDVSAAIREPAVTADVSAVSAVPEVRSAMVEAQRSWVSSSGAAVVVEGRDIGTVVFPGAVTKVYLTASPRVRAERRAREAGTDVDGEEERIRRRDELDSSRATSPLRPADDAWILDTGGMSIDEVVEAVADHHLNR